VRSRSTLIDTLARWVTSFTLTARTTTAAQLCYSRRVLSTVRWDDWNTAHIARHGVSEEEVDDVVLDRASLRLRSRAGTYVVLGVTAAGRPLFSAGDGSGDDRQEEGPRVR